MKKSALLLLILIPSIAACSGAAPDEGVTGVGADELVMDRSLSPSLTGP